MKEATLKVFVPEKYIIGRGVIIEIVQNLGYGTIVSRDELPRMIMEHQVDPKIITEHNLTVIEE